MRRVAAAVFVVAAVGGVATVGGADTGVEQSATTEAWYQPNPTCPPPIGCLAQLSPPPMSVYSAGTMHVGYAAGRETARSYVAFGLGDLGGRIEAATLTVPLSTSPADGTTAAATAAVQVCLAFGPFERVEGSFEQPPSVDCLTSAPMTYVATPTPRLQANLDGLLADLASASGLALLPDATKVQPSDNWRVVFSANDRADSAKTPPASLTLTLAADAPDPTPGDAFDDQPALDDFGGFDDFVESPLGTEFADPAPVDRPVENNPPVALGRDGGVAPTPVVSLAYPYKAAWLLPLVLLGLFAAILTAMTKDLAPSKRLGDRAD